MYCLCISNVCVMYWQCNVYVSGMYHGCIMVLRVYWWCIRCVLVMYWIIMPPVKRRVKRRVQVPGCKSLRKSLRRHLWCSVFYMYCQCIQNVSWMYYDCNIHVYLMYYECIRSCAPHLCFPPYSAHHLFGAQPIRLSSFGHQQPMGLAPVGMWLETA